MRTTVRNSYTPNTSDYCNMIVVDNDTLTNYIFDSDGVWTQFTPKTQEGAPKSYVDSKALQTLDEAKSYADEGDAATLAAAKAYTDSYSPSGMATKTYVDDQDAATLQAAKDYADSMDVVTLDQAQSLISSATGSVSGDLTEAINTLRNSLSSVAFTGAYADISGTPDVPVITMTTTDPGEGVPLAANHFIAVYVGD